jgi:hypothetical protein
MFNVITNTLFPISLLYVGIEFGGKHVNFHMSPYQKQMIDVKTTAH